MGDHFDRNSRAKLKPQYPIIESQLASRNDLNDTYRLAGKRLETKEVVMPRHSIDGIEIAYEISGEGVGIGWSTGGPGVRGVSRPTANELASAFRVLIYDCRNQGESDIALSDAPSMYETWADDLRTMLQAHQMDSVIAGGGSGGAMISLRFYAQWREDVKGLFLGGIPNDDRLFWEVFADYVYFQSAEVAEKEGMQAIVESDIGWDIWKSRVEQNPRNRELLLSMNEIDFASCMRRWGEWLLNGRAQYGGLSDDELSQTDVPVVIVPGADDQHELEYKGKTITVTGHPRRMAEQLHELIPGSTIVESADVKSQGRVDIIHRYLL